MKLIKYWYCYIGIFFILVDRVTKLWAEHRLIESHYVTSFLSYELVHNTGVSFSLFSDYGWYGFWFLTVVIGILLVFFTRLMIERKKAGDIILGQVLVVAGGFGNLCDRVWYGYVIDFIHVHYKQWSYPYFNVADMCIVVGVFIITTQIFSEQLR